MFAEGGGQPADVGSLRIIRDTEPILNIEVDVFHVLRGADGRNIHLVTETWDFPLLELPKGTKVLQTICWERRHRHMLYHSGQHLLSAVAGETFGWATLGWQLSDNGCYVVLNTPDISTQELKALENKANEYIKDNLSVTTYLYNQGETDARLEKARTKGLPDNYGDSIRIVQIGDLENNMCCGTHVTSLSQLEMIKLLRVEKGKKNKKKEEGKEHSTLLHFMVGRKEIFEKFHDMYSTESQLSSTLERQPCDIHDTVLEMKESQKKAKQRIKALEEENVMSLIDLFKEKKPTQEIFSLHR
ncbi:Alanyl-tRNA editing protein Aarsd1 [Homalodisca vitripennis]|nr:Alanyl-tRNA editing protein Aarsd1 [Homalodisca vitripennis]